MKPPKRCPQCRSRGIRVVMKPKEAPGEWMLLCRDCLYNEAYGPHALNTAADVLKKLQREGKMIGVVLVDAEKRAAH